MEAVAMSQVLLALSNQRLAGYRGRWIYCGQDYIDMLRWERRLGSASRLSCATSIPVAFQNLRSQFIEWTSRIGEAHGDALEWWITPLAARNTNQTPIFLHLCYLHILLEKSKEELEKGCLIICEDWFLLRTLEINLLSRGLSVKRMPWWWVTLTLRFVGRLAKVVARWVLALAVQTGSLIAARWTARAAAPDDAPAAGDKNVLIHTCVDEICLGDDGKFRDRFFSSLPDWLSRHGCRVTTIPWLYNIERSTIAAYRWFRNSSCHFLIIDDYARFRDFPSCISRILRSGFVRYSETHFGKYDVSPLLTRERVRNIASADLIKFLLYEQALNKWLKNGNRCDVFVDMFENMASERSQLKAIRAQQPLALTVGYQHAPVPSELIGYGITSREWETGVFPSRIVTHGRGSCELLIAQGFPERHVMEGPALRHDYLVGENSVKAKRCSDTNSGGQVLVLLPLDLPSAVELLIRMLGVKDIHELEGQRVALKVHPMMPVAQLIREAQIAGLPESWRWTQGALHEELAKARLVVGMGTGAIFEAAAFALPVLCVGRELGFAYNPLDTFAARYEICRTIAPAAFRERLVEILGETSPGTKFNLEELSREIRSGLGNLDDRHCSAFV
jgi:hypothetical protein